MGILNIDDVPPPLGAGGGEGNRPAGAGSAAQPGSAGFGQATTGAAGASTAAAAAGGGVAGAAPTGAGQPVIPPHVDGSAPPPQTPRPPLPAPDGPAASSMFDTSALTGPGSGSAPAGPGAAASSEPARPIEADPVRTLELKPQIVEQLSTVFDPEIPVNIYELGLIYDVLVDKDSLAVIKMTLTAPGCPAAVTLPAEVQGKVKGIEGVSDARVDLVWEPPWDKDRMSDAAKLQLGIFD